MIKHLWRTLFGFVQAELRQSGAYLVPLRIFIGIGWLRACAEKITDPGWSNGSSLSGFLTQQLDQGLIVFPFYQRLVVDAFLPHATWLSWVIVLGELLWSGDLRRVPDQCSAAGRAVHEPELPAGGPP